MGISLVIKNVKKTSQIALFEMSAIIKFVFKKWKQLHFLKENYPNYTKQTQLCMYGNYMFPETLAKKKKPEDSLLCP